MIWGLSDKNLSDDFDCYQNRVFNVKVERSALQEHRCSAGYTDYALFSRWMTAAEKIRPWKSKPNGQLPDPPVSYADV
jgi:hypothetical protein